MKIGIDARLWNQGGVGRYTRNLVLNLLKIDGKNTYILFVRKQDYENIKYQISRLPKPASPLAKQSEAARGTGGQVNIKFKNKLKIVSVNILWHSFSEQLRFPQVLNREKLDLMHFPYFSVPVLYKKPYVVTIHDLISHHFVSGQASTLPLWLLGFKVLAYRLVVASAAKKSKKIIAVSDFTKRDIVNTLKVDKNKIEVIYEAADDTYKTSNKTAGIDTYFLYVGNVYPHKNVGLLLEAFKVLSKENTKLKLVFVGKEDFLYKKLKNHVKKETDKGKIIFFDNINDEQLASLYKNAICLVRPSFMEGFSLPPLEAMASECLVLASDIPVHREILGEAAIYFNPAILENMVEKMMFVVSLNDKTKQHMLEKGLKKAKEFSWRKTAEQTLRVYNSLSNGTNNS